MTRDRAPARAPVKAREAVDCRRGMAGQGFVKRVAKDDVGHVFRSGARGTRAASDSARGVRSGLRAKVARGRQSW
jgi:hypothetical protein